MKRAIGDHRSILVLLLILLLYMSLAAALTIAIPLGEAPDELAHFQYIRYVAQEGHWPTNEAEREAAGYRANWPGLYQRLAAPIVSLTENEGPTSLKVIGENPRRLLVFDGFAAQSVIHTLDEAFPYRGIVRAWHSARLLSVLFSLGTLLLLYLTLRRQFSSGLSLAAIAVIALIPEFLVISAVLNDDSPLGFLVALYLWLLWPLFNAPGSWQRYLALGLVAGLTLATKYSTLFLALDLLWLHWLIRRKISLRQLVIFSGGLIAGAAGWFGFVIVHFNQISRLGWLRGVLAPFLAGGTDVSTRRIATLLSTDSLTAPLAAVTSTNWLAWFRTLFVTFWFPDSVPAWLWISTLLVSGLLAWGVLRAARAKTASNNLLLFSLGHIALFLPLPMLRFYLTGNIAETAQGRHLLFPILVPLAFLIVWSVQGWLQARGSRPAFIALGLLAILMLASLGTVWPRITLAGQPRLPVRTGPPASISQRLDLTYGDEITLLGVDAWTGAEAFAHTFPLTLVWQAQQPPSQDYTVRLEVRDDQEQVIGVWRGQPLNGRYPTRAWEVGDHIYDEIWLPLLANLPPDQSQLLVQVFDRDGQEVSPNGDGEATLLLEAPPVSSWKPLPQLTGTTLRVPDSQHLDRQPSYRYRATIPFIIEADLNPASSVVLQSPAREFYRPTETLTSAERQLVLFTVDWTWASGPYDLVVAAASLDDGQIEAALQVQHNSRRTTAPAITYPVRANFGNQVMLLGYDLPQRRTEPGQSLDVILYWQALQTTNTDYKVFNHLLDADNVQRGGQDRTPLNYYSTILWNPGEVVVDSYQSPVDPDAPDGIYWLDVGLYAAQDAGQTHLSLMQDGQALDGNSVRLGPIKVGGQPQASLPQGKPQTAISYQFGDLIALRGYDLAQDQQHLQIGLQWAALAIPPVDYTLFVHILDQQGGVVLQADGPPVSGLYPTSFWEAGEQILDERTILIGELGGGTYTIRLGWYDPATGERLGLPDSPGGFIDLVDFEID